MPGQNYFELFGLAPRFAIDLNQLELSFRQWQFELQADRHPRPTKSERRAALQLSATARDGYRALRHSASRAQCLLSLVGQKVAQATVSPTLLLAQMEWRAAIEEVKACRDNAALQALAKRLKRRIGAMERDLAAALDARGDFTAAAQRVNELRCYEKLRGEITDALAALTAVDS